MSTDCGSSLSASLSISFILLIAGCSVSGVPINATSWDAAASLSNPLNQFAISLFNRLAQQNAESNVLVSPFSVSTALSMLMLGTRGNSSLQLRHALELDQVNDTEDSTVHQLFHEVIEERIEKCKSLMLANSLMIRKESAQIAILQKYKTDLQSMYHAKMSDVDFITKGPQIMTDANNWVRNSTRSMIKTVLDEPPSEDTRAIILSAISFKGKWEKQFNKSRTRKGVFFNNGVNETQTDFMSLDEESFGYKRLRMGGEDVQALELAYVNDSLSMILLLPDARDGLQRILSPGNQSQADLLSAVAEVSSFNETQSFNLRLPKFKFETEYTLNPTLVQLGIRDIFSSTAADLSGMNGQRNLYVSLIKHKAAIRVDEEGTEAAAVTAVHVMTESAIITTDFTADHPFLFLIKDNITGVILFIGKVEKF